MSAKQGGKGAATVKGKKTVKVRVEEKREDILQAVILADSFQDRFRPFTLEKPRCLLPLANTPLIEYTLEFLAMNGVQEVFIYCGAHTEQIENYIADSARWSPTSKISPFSSLEFIRVSDARSIGDFLRDLDKRGVIGGDFYLVHGDLVANISLDAALAKHRARREANRDAIMTVVLRSAGDGDHRTKAHGITPVFVIESSTGRCLHFEESHPLQSDHYLTLDPTLLEHSAFEVRSDLIDCGIDICTPDVLALWSESFDYELPRKNFLHGVLKDWELNGKLIHAEIVDEGYAARASNLQLYDAISRDVLGRWTYPLVPDSNLVADHSYKLSKQGVSLEHGVTILGDVQFSNVVIGKGTRLGSGSTITHSIIGRSCQIGKNVHIENSYIWDHVVIEDGASVRHSVLGDFAIVGKHSSVPEGSTISFGVQIGKNIQLSGAQVLCLVSESGEGLDTDVNIVGPDGRGAMYVDPVDDDDDDAEDGDPSILQKSLIYSLDGLNLSNSSISTLSSYDSADSDDEDSHTVSGPTGDSSFGRNRLSSFASDDSASAARKSGAFHADAVNGLLDALRADDVSDFDGAKLEFMGLRLANDASDQTMRRAVAVAFARHAAELLASMDAARAADRALNSKTGAIKFIREVGVGGADAEEAEFALALQKALLNVDSLEPAKAGVLLSAMLQQLYDQEVLKEDGILAWWADRRAADGESMSKAREKCRSLIEWLETAEEEDSDEESDV